MAGDHKCPVCGSTFTRSQHVARHMRSHTGDRPYKCTHCGDQFARSDLLSRHVNKCHSADKLKAGAAAGRRKGRQASNGNGPQPTTEEQTPAVAMGYRHPQPNIVGSLSDPFSNPASHYPNYRSAPYTGRPSFDSSHPGSFPSSAAASVDNLHAQPASTYSAVANSNYARASDPFAYRTYPSYSVPQTQPNLFPSSYKESSAVQVQSASDPFVGYDLPTPLAYPHGKERTSSHSSSIHSYNIQNSVDHPQLQQDASYYQQHQPAVRYGSDPQTNGLQSVDGGQQQYVPAPNAENGLGEGGFSSAFGLMSLDDPNVIAGVHDGVPFFDNNNTPQQPPDLHALLQQAAPQSSEAIDWNALVEPPGLSPAAREREANALREIWSAFLRDPTTGLKADGTEKGKPNFPTPSLHRRSSSYSGQVRDASNALPSIVYKSSSNSDGQRTNASGVVAHLEAQAARDHANYPQQPQRRASQNAMNVPHVGTMHNPDALRSYEEAILSRKAPVLKMPPKIRSRDSAPNGSGVPSGSSVLPSISSTSRPTLPGGVGSLAGSASSMPVSAAAASAVPVGAIMNQGLAALQQQPQRHERPVVPMPKPRSRPSTSSGYHNETSPTSAVSSGRATPAHRSEPPSRPRTSAGSNDNTTGVVSASGDSSRPSTANSSPPSTHPTQPNTQSQTIPASTNLSGVAPAAESRPGTANPSPPQSSSYAMAHLQPSNNTFAPYIQYSGNMGPPMGPVVYSQPQPTYAYIPQSQNVQHDDLSQGVVSRPTYKRLASQILEPAVTKRQNVRRGSNAHENPIDDDDEEEADHVQHDRVSTSRSTSGSSGAPLGASASSSYQSESPMTTYRRMSEPSSLATRMYPRPTQVAVGPAVRELNQ